jgi:hypothetical protein
MLAVARKSVKLGLFHIHRNFKDLLIIAMQVGVASLPLFWALSHAIDKLLPGKDILQMVRDMEPGATFSAIVLGYFHNAPSSESLFVGASLVMGILILTLVLSAAYVDISRSISMNTPLNRMVLTKIFGKLELSYFTHLLWLNIVSGAFIALAIYAIFMFPSLIMNVLTTTVILGGLLWLSIHLSLGFVSVADEEGGSLKVMFGSAAHKVWDATHVYVLWFCIFIPLGLVFAFLSNGLEALSRTALAANSSVVIDALLLGAFYVLDFAQIVFQIIGLMLLVGAVAHLYVHHKKAKKNK